MQLGLRTGALKMSPYVTPGHLPKPPLPCQGQHVKIRQIGSLPVLLKPLAAGYNGRNITVNPRNPFPLIFTTTSTNIELENHHLLEALLEESSLPKLRIWQGLCLLG